MIKNVQKMTKNENGKMNKNRKIGREHLTHIRNCGGYGMKITEFEETTWRWINLLRARAYQITTAKVCVFSDSVLYMGEMRGDPNAAWN